MANEGVVCHWMGKTIDLVLSGNECKIGSSE